MVTCRLLQGLSAGEWGSSTAFIVEWAPENSRGFFGSFQQASVAGELLLGSGMSALFATVLDPEQMESWGWRAPFLIGAILLPVGIYMRRNIEETPAFRAAQATTKAAGWVASKAFGFTVLWTVSYYVMLSFMPTFCQRFVGLTRTAALWV